MANNADPDHAGKPIESAAPLGGPSILRNIRLNATRPATLGSVYAAVAISTHVPWPGARRNAGRLTATSVIHRPATTPPARPPTRLPASSGLGIRIVRAIAFRAGVREHQEDRCPRMPPRARAVAASVMGIAYVLVSHVGDDVAVPRDEPDHGAGTGAEGG